MIPPAPIQIETPYLVLMVVAGMSFGMAVAWIAIGAG